MLVSWSTPPAAEVALASIEASRIRIEDLGAAVICWARAQGDRSIAISEAAFTFNQPIEAIAAGLHGRPEIRVELGQLLLTPRPDAHHA